MQLLLFQSRCQNSKMSHMSSLEFLPFVELPSVVLCCCMQTKIMHVQRPDKCSERNDLLSSSFRQIHLVYQWHRISTMEYFKLSLKWYKILCFQPSGAPEQFHKRSPLVPKIPSGVFGSPSVHKQESEPLVPNVI